MKKFLLVVVLLAVATVAAAPWVAGVLVERELQAKVAEVQKRTTWMNVSLALEDYQRGYASSTATFRVDDKRFPLVIQHAPFSATGLDIARIVIKHSDNKLPDSDLRVNLARQLLWKQELPASQKGDAHFAGGEIVMRGPESTFPYNNRLSLIWKGTRSDTFSLAPTQFDVIWDKEGLSIHNDVLEATGDVNIRIQGLREILHTVAVEDDALPLRFELGADGAQTIAYKDGKEISKISLSNSSYEAGLIEGEQGYDFIIRQKYHFQYSGENFAELDKIFAIAPDTFNSQFVVSNFSPKTTRSMMGFVREIADEVINQEKTYSDMAVNAVGLSLYQDLLARDLSLKSQIELSGAGKAIRFEANVLEHFKNKSDLDEFMKNEKSAFRLLQGSTLRFQIDREWLARGELAKSLAPEKLEQAGFIADEKGFTLNFAVQEDGLVRNGKLLTDEEIAAIPAQFKALFSEIGQ